MSWTTAPWSAVALTVVLTACSSGGTEQPATAPSATTSAAPSSAAAEPSPATTAAPSLGAAPARADGRPQVDVFSTSLEVPWDLAFLPDGRILLTERPGARSAGRA